MAACSSSPTTGQILALDPATGSTLWTFKPEVPFGGKRGIGIGEGLLFAGLRDSRVIAISQETGKIVWTYQRGPGIPAQGMSSAPAYGNGVVVAVVSLGDNFLRGRAIGIDAKTGNGLWSWEVVPGPGEPGHETWPQDSDIWKYGGGALWTTPSVDADLGLVYLETGNAVPQFGGELRPGNNLYNNSVVALDLKTGKMRWYYQLVHHDIWEHDVSTPLVLYDTTIGGRPRKAAGGDADRRHAVHPRPGDRQADRPRRRTAGEAERVPEDVADAAVHRRRRSRRPGVRGQGHDPAGVRRRLLLRSDYGRDAQSLPSAHEHAADADGVQPADELPVRDRVREPGLDEARADRLGIHPADAACRPEAIRAARGDRCADREDRLAEALAVFRMRGQRRRAHHRRRSDVPSGARRRSSGVRREDRRRCCGSFKPGRWVWAARRVRAVRPRCRTRSRGEQFIALANNRAVWAFKAGGTVGPRPAPVPPPTTREWGGRVADTDAIQLGDVLTFNIAAANKKIDWQNDYDVNPTRAHVKVGTAVTWTNKSTLSHTIVARDGSWATGVIQPGATGTATIARAGTYEYICKEHPWSIGQLTVD